MVKSSPKSIPSRRENQENAMALVVTLPEAGKLWNKSRKTIEMQILKGRLVARQSIVGGAWLISTDSMTELWGKPTLDDAMRALFTAVRK